MSKTAGKKFSPETYLKWYEDMLMMRRFEEKCAQLYGQQKIKGFCHLYTGQEAIVAGTMTALQPGDKLITAYRDHAHALGCGITPNAVMAELFGKVDGCSKGKGGSMHMFSKEFNFFGGHGIVGGQIPLGAGIAFAEKYNGTENICVAFMGDGAIRQGALHEAFNMAMMWKLPVVFVCENNGYAMGTSVARSTNVTDIYTLADAYGMPGEAVDGMTCETVHTAMEKAAERARKGDGPSFLEIRTYRYRGHSMSDPAKYRSKEEVEEYKLQDPIEKVKTTLTENNFASAADLEAIDARVEQEVEDSVVFAENSPYPPAEDIYSDVYKQADYPFILD